MKKIILMLVLVTFAFAGSALAATQTVSGDNTYVTCGATTTLDIQLSPKVKASYTGLNRVGTADFYVIGTYHTAGTKTYATASTLTKIYYQEATASKNLATIFAAIPSSVADAQSASKWSGWSN